jgi:hypothetical protein
MSVLRNDPKGARFAPFGLSFCLFAVLPSEIGYQDLAALMARQAGVTRPAQTSTTFTNVKVAAFSFPRPVGISIPHAPAYRLVSLDSESSDITGAITRSPFGEQARALRPSDFPVVDRRLKGDRLPLAVEPAPDAAPVMAPAAPVAPVANARSAEAAAPEPLDEELQSALQAPPLPQYDVALSLEGRPAAAARAATETSEAAAGTPDGFSVKTASLFFGNGAMGVTSGSLERWAPGEEPVVVLPPGASDTDLKAGALKPGAAVEGGETIAGKGVSGAEPKRQKTPAERLGLNDKARAKAEKCLADAVYFEARGEAVRGQMAVAQVVLNRVFSGFYPTTVCGVVYQNAHRHLACQFTFACDDVADVVREPDMWVRAKKIAKASLDGLLWLPEVGKSTHYHAYWVRPSWVHEMKKLYRTGVHTFYRPRAWGDGSDAPSWGDPGQTAALSAKL